MEEYFENEMEWSGSGLRMVTWSGDGAKIWQREDLQSEVRVTSGICIRIRVFQFRPRLCVAFQLPRQSYMLKWINGGRMQATHIHRQETHIQNSMLHMSTAGSEQTDKFVFEARYVPGTLHRCRQIVKPFCSHICDPALPCLASYPRQTQLPDLPGSSVMVYMLEYLSQSFRFAIMQDRFSERQLMVLKQATSRQNTQAFCLT